MFSKKYSTVYCLKGRFHTKPLFLVPLYESLNSGRFRSNSKNIPKTVLKQSHKSFRNFAQILKGFLRGFFQRLAPTNCKLIYLY